MTAFQRSFFSELQVKVSVKLCRMRNLAHIHALFALQSNEILDQMLGENAAGGQVVVIGFQSVQRILQTGGQTGQLGLFFLGQMIEVHIIGTPTILMGIDLILDTVQTGHQQGCVAEIRVAGSIGVTQLKAAQLGALGISGDTDDGTAVGSGVTNGHRSLKARHQALEGVGAGVGDGTQGADVL